MIPRIENALGQIEFVTYPNLTYRIDWDNKTATGDITDLEALEQAIFHRILTERYAYPIYDDNYGTELQQYIGQSFGFLEATIENTLKDSLLQDDRITNIRVTKISRITSTDEEYNANSALLEFDVYTNMGAINMRGIPIQL